MTPENITACPFSTRERLLALLQPPGAWHSGEDMATGLGISRTAVSKHIRMLREAGHVIESSPRKGYCLLAEAEPCTLEAVRAELQTSLLGQSEWRWLRRTGSTNRDAMDMAASGGPEGAVVVAERQEAGRGRKGRTWVSAPGSLCFSVLLRPDLDAGAVLTLSDLACRAVAEAIEELTGARPEVKAPNDLLLNGRKCCGVLVELGLRSEEMEWAVLGIGVNVNVPGSAFPPELQDRATSLLAELGTVVNRAVLLQHILQHLERRYLLLNQTTGTASGA